MNEPTIGELLIRIALIALVGWTLLVLIHRLGRWIDFRAQLAEFRRMKSRGELTPYEIVILDSEFRDGYLGGYSEAMRRVKAFLLWQRLEGEGRTGVQRDKEEEE